MINLDNINGCLAKVRVLVVNFTIVTALAMLVVILLRQIFSSAILVEPILVTDSLESRGYTPEVTARIALEEMLEIQRTAATRKEGEWLSPEWDRFDMEVPGSGITIGTIGRGIRESLGIRERKISGEFVGTERGYNFRLRYSGGARSGQSLVTGSSEEIDGMIRAAAEQTVQRIAPFVYASFLHATRRKNELEEAIKFTLEQGPEEDRKWVYNLQGILLAEATKYDEAIDYYDKALGQDSQFAIAYHNKANALHKLKRHVSALQNFLQAASLDSGLRDSTDEAKLRINAGKEIGREPARKDEEIEMYRLAYIRDPDAIDALIYWGRALITKRDPDYRGAIAKFSEYTRRSKNSAEVYELWGRALEGIGEGDKAIEKYNTALNLDPVTYSFLQDHIDGLKSQSNIH